MAKARGEKSDDAGRWLALPQTTRSRRPRRMPRARAGNCLDGDNEKRKSKREREGEREREEKKKVAA